MAGEDLFQNQRAPWLTVDPTAAGSVTTPPDSGDLRLHVDPTTKVLAWKDSAGATFPLAAQSNFSATAAPAITDDSGDGYAVGSRWIDVTNDKEYVCLDASVGAAVWTETTGAGGGGGGTENHAICQGRLTLETGVAISTSDQSAKTTLYFTPHHGNLIGTYTDAAWRVQTFTEKSLSLAGLTADSNYDIWIEDLDLSLSSTIWTNDTTRATALASQDGVYVKTGDVSKRYLGTIRINATGGQCEDTLVQRYVWNAYNRKRRSMEVRDATDSWTYATATWRAANGTTTDHQLRYVVGLAEDGVTCEVQARVGSSSTQVGNVAVGVDSTSTPSGLFIDAALSVTASIATIGRYSGLPAGVGYHFLVWLEYVRAGTVTFYGDATIPTNSRSGIQAEVSA